MPIILVLLLLGGCTTVWEKPGGTPAQFEADLSRCKFEAMRRDGVAWPDEVNLCLRGMGYQRRE